MTQGAHQAPSTAVGAHFDGVRAVGTSYRPEPPFDYAQLLLRLKREAQERGFAATETMKEAHADRARADQAERLISGVQAELAAGRRPRAIDLMNDTLDPLLLAQRFDDARVLLFAVSQNPLPLALLLSALALTAPWRHPLGDARAAVVDRAKELALRDGGADKLRAVARFF